MEEAIQYSPQYLGNEGMIPIADSQPNPQDSLPNINFDVIGASLATFPDYDLDWPEVMGNIDDYMVPDNLRPAYSPSTSIVADDIYQERVIYLVKKLKSYPNLFVTQGSTAFIHFKLYSEGIPTAIGDALGICALYGQKNEKNEYLVFRTIGQKAKSLVEISNPQTPSVLEQLASVQALIFYQIIRLFDGDIRQRADAERTNSLLWQWTQQLKVHLSQITIPSRTENIISSTDPKSYAWRTWVLAESLRRTILVSFLLQGLYCYLKHGWNKVHFEIKNLSFYGQQALWNAHSEYSWKLALSECSPLFLHLNTWDADMQNAKPSDMDDLGVLMMTVTNGVDGTRGWLGEGYRERFGLTK